MYLLLSFPSFFAMHMVNINCYVFIHTNFLHEIERVRRDLYKPGLPSSLKGVINHQPHTHSGWCALVPSTLFLACLQIGIGIFQATWSPFPSQTYRGQSNTACNLPRRKPGGGVGHQMAEMQMNTVYNHPNTAAIAGNVKHCPHNWWVEWMGGWGCPLI